MTVEYRVISIGTLGRNLLWNESAPVRTSHATTTLVRDEDKRILVDPSLPAPALAARYNERTGGTLSDVTDVFCTTLRPVHRRSIAALAHARWWVDETELVMYRNHLEGLEGSAQRLSESDAADIDADLKLLKHFHPAPEKLTRQVQLYPLRGPSPGSAGLLLTPPTMTIVIAGDAAITAEHVLAGQIWQGCADREAALETLRDLIELGDVIVPGHDNVMSSSGRWVY